MVLVRAGLLVAACVFTCLAVGCETPPPAAPPPSAAPARSAGALGAAANAPAGPCVQACVDASQMQARAIEAIEADCHRMCEEDPSSWPKHP